MIREGHAGKPGELSDFQRATARHAFHQLYRDENSTQRFLVADETGLGKTHVAREVITQTVNHLQHVDDVERIDIVYVCSNADIAAQNIRKLNITGSQDTSFATRLSLLITRPELLNAESVGGGTGNLRSIHTWHILPVRMADGEKGGACGPLRSPERPPWSPWSTGDGGAEDLPGGCDQP